ncbi:MAG: hypothetical protein GY754_25555 [bacterium]|nr:hypothetical protein [bacterium]
MTDTEIDQLDDNILIVKARFKSMNLYGHLLIIFNSSKKIESFNVIASSYSDAYKMEPNENWDKFEEFIADLKWKGNFNNGLTVSLMEHLTSFSQDIRAVEALFDHTYNYDFDKLEVVLLDFMNRVIHDKNLIIEAVIQEVTPQDFKATKEEREKPKGDEEQPAEPGENIDVSSIVLQIKPILSPVKGKPIYSLKIGDMIMANIAPTSDNANYVIDFLDLRGEKKIRPTPAKVIDIKAGLSRNDPIEILTEISQGIYGKFFEDEKQVKLRMYNPAIDGLLEQSPGTYASDDDQPPFSKGAIFLIALFLIIIILAVVLVFLVW